MIKQLCYLHALACIVLPLLLGVCFIAVRDCYADAAYRHRCCWLGWMMTFWVELGWVGLVVLLVGCLVVCCCCCGRGRSGLLLATASAQLLWNTTILQAGQNHAFVHHRAILSQQALSDLCTAIQWHIYSCELRFQAQYRPGHRMMVVACITLVALS